MKKSLKWVIKLCIFAVSIGVFAFFGYRIYNQYANKNNKINEKILAVVKNLSFDERKNLLTWGSVNHADSYIANINGVEYNVELNEMNYVPVSNTTEFKVKAVDSTGEYATPSWSKTYSYTLNNEFSYSKVSAYINDALPTNDLKKVVSAYVKDNSLYTNCYFTKNGIGKMMELQIEYDDEVSSIADCVNTGYRTIHIKNTYETANYDSASYLLQSNSFVGEMEQRRLEGYEFSVVSSQVGKEEKNSGYHIFATYKLTKGDDVKYIESDMLCGIYNESSNEKANYTTKLLDTENVYKRECSYTELKGDEITFAKSMDQVIIQKY